MAEDSSANDYRKHLWDALRAGQEQYDKYLLTLSSGGLAISLTLLKDVFTKAQIFWPSLLVVSWALFCGCIVTTIISFLTSQKCLESRINRFEESLTTGDSSNLYIPDLLAKLTTLLNYLSGALLVSAIAATIIFASVNLQRGVLMSNKQGNDTNRGYTPPPPPGKTNPGAGYTPPPPPTPTQQAPPPKK